jgi:hypothetical protein
VQVDQLLAGWMGDIDVDSAPERVATAQREALARDENGPADPFLRRASDQEIERAAFHESAHAVIAHRGGRHVSRVCLREDATGFADYGACDERDFGDLLAALTADLAGPAAELAKWGADECRYHQLAHSSDLLQARMRADKLRSLAPGLGLSNAFLVKMALAAVRANWRAITRCAYVLRACGELNSAEIGVLCGRLQ